MRYWVHERYNEKRFVILHKSTCKFCSDEKITLQNSKNNVNDKWHGGFESLRDALDFATSIDDCKIYQCKVCDPLGQNQDQSDDIGLALQDTRNLTIMENGGSKVIPSNTSTDIPIVTASINPSANKQIPDIDFFKEIKSEFPNAYLDEGKLVLPGITLNDLQQKFPDLTQEIIKSKFLGVAFNAPKIDFRTLKQAFPDIYLDEDKLILPGLDFETLKSKFPELTQAALKAKFPSVVYNAPKVDFNTLKEKFPNIYMNGAKLILPTITYAALKSKFPYLTIDALKDKFREISFNASDIDYKTLKEKFPDIYLKEGTLYLPGLTFSDLKQKFPDLTMEALKNNFPNIVFGEDKKKNGIFKLLLPLLGLVLLILLIMWLMRSCNGEGENSLNNNTSNSTISQSQGNSSKINFSDIKEKFPDATLFDGKLTLPTASFDDLNHEFPDVTLEDLNDKFSAIEFGKDSPNNTSVNAASNADDTKAEDTTESTTSEEDNSEEDNSDKPGSQITFDDIQAAFPDATFDRNKLVLPSISFDELKAEFPNLTIEKLKASFPHVVFGKANESTYCIYPFTTTENLNFREKAATDNVPLDVIPRGRTVIGLEEDGDWVRVAYNGEIGYCNLNYLTKHEEWIVTDIDKPLEGQTEIAGKITASDATSITINGERIFIELISEVRLYSYADNTLTKVKLTRDQNLTGGIGIVVKDENSKTTDILVIK